ncbi:centromere kinetochore component CENP-T-domain-containing protein [Diaporthe sp. PMI_573]|nr:centromere kinetochore component CENP-T-domain-containing protein [Diaporthaceae sp. PMI_573]
MSSPPRQRSPSRATPRRSSSHPPKDIDAATSQQTPNVSRSSAPPSSAARFSIRTPGNQVLDFRSSRHLPSASGRKGAGAGSAVPTQFTPHGRAAIRTLDSRRAAINEISTPGRNRRRSVRDQRETPRDVLRALSRSLAPKSKVITTSSSSSPDDPTNSGRKRGGRGQSRSRRGGPVTIPEDPDDSDEFPIDRPRLSLPIDDVSDDDLRPPRTSGLEDLEDNFTMQSIELPRRQTLDNQSRYSMRMSDYGPMNDLPSDDDVGVDSAFFPRANWAGDEGDDSGMAGLGDDDAAFERIDDDEAGRRETLGRESFGAIEVNFDDADQSTVMLQPQVESSPRRESSSSPRNEAFGMEDAPLPEEMEVDDNAAQSLDLRSNGEAEAEGDSDIDFGDLASGAAIAEAVGQTTKPSRSNRFKKPGKKISQHGIEYPSLPPGVVKRVAQRFAGKSKISPDTLAALVQASDWFFEQLGDDLSAYAKHAGRKTIEESDMLTLMRRQRQVNANTTPFALAQRHLPRELLQELRMPPPGRVQAKKRRRSPSAGEEGDVT